MTSFATTARLMVTLLRLRVWEPTRTMVITAAGRTSKMYLVGDRLSFPHNCSTSTGTVAVIHENQNMSLTYWVDEDNGDNVLLFDDAINVSLIEPEFLDF
jgi:hypothetical protein